MRFLENIEKVVGLFGSATQQKEEAKILEDLALRYILVAKSLRGIQSLTKNAVLTDIEQRKLEKLCQTLPNTIKAILALHLTPKIHGIASKY